MKNSLSESIRNYNEYDSRKEWCISISFEHSLKRIFEKFFWELKYIFISDEKCFLAEKFFKCLPSKDDIEVYSIVTKILLDLITTDYATYFYNLTDDITRDESTCSHCKNCYFMREFYELNKAIEDLIDSNKENLETLTEKEISRIIVRSIQHDVVDMVISRYCPKH
jgi:uncharacterized protein (DUF2164 family)